MMATDVARMMFPRTLAGAAVGGAGSNIRHGIVAADNGDGTYRIRLDTGVEIDMRYDAPLSAGDRVSIVNQDGSWVIVSDQALGASIDAQERELADFSKTISGRLDELGADLSDGKVETWFYASDPTTSNEPASLWDSGERKSHAGDLYYNTSTGKTWYWTGSAWAGIQDEDIRQALDDAAAAQDTADGKRRVFTSQPAGPYDKGDLWVEGGTGDIWVCRLAEGNTGKFYQSDWVLASKYTDDSATETLAGSFALQKSASVSLYCRRAEHETAWHRSRYVYWNVFKPASGTANAPVLFWTSIPLNSVDCSRPYGSNYMSYYEYYIEWPGEIGAVDVDMIPECLLAMSCENDMAEAYAWSRDAGGIGPIVVSSFDSGVVGVDGHARLEIFCSTRIVSNS